MNFEKLLVFHTRGRTDALELKREPTILTRDCYLLFFAGFVRSLHYISISENFALDFVDLANLPNFDFEHLSFPYAGNGFSALQMLNFVEFIWCIC